MEKQSSNFSLLFKRLSKKPGMSSNGSSSRWKSKISTGLRWKWRRGDFSLQNWFVDHIIFKIVSVFEAIFIGSRLCFFFLCCGCGRV